MGEVNSNDFKVIPAHAFHFSPRQNVRSLANASAPPNYAMQKTPILRVSPKRENPTLASEQKINIFVYYVLLNVKSFY